MSQDFCSVSSQVCAASVLGDLLPGLPGRATGHTQHSNTDTRWDCPILPAPEKRDSDIGCVYQGTSRLRSFFAEQLIDEPGATVVRPLGAAVGDDGFVAARLLEG